MLPRNGLSVLLTGSFAQMPRTIDSFEATACSRARLKSHPCPVAPQHCGQARFSASFHWAAALHSRAGSPPAFFASSQARNSGERNLRRIIMEAMEQHRPNEAVPPPELGESPPIDPGDPSAESATPADLLADQVLVPPPPPRPGKESSQLPMMILVEAGLTVFDGVLVIVFGVLWKTNPDALLQLLEGRAGISLVLGAAPIILSALISKRNEKRDTEMPGSVWARAGFIVGTILCLMTLAIPVLATIRAMLQPV